MQRKILPLLIMFFLLRIISPVNAENIHKKIGIGLGYPFLSVKYGLSSKLSIEARGAFGKGIQVYGGPTPNRILQPILTIP